MRGQFTTTILVIACSLVPLVILALFLIHAHKRRQAVTATVLALTLLHEIVLVAFPACYSALTGFSSAADSHVTADQMLKVYLGEMMYVVFFAFGMILSARRQLSARMTPADRRALDEHRFMTILLIGGAVTYIGYLLAPSYTPEDISRHWEITVKTGVLENLRSWTDTFFQWPGIIAAAIVVSEKSVSRTWRVLGAVILMAELTCAMLYGLRGGIVYVLCLVAAAGYYTSLKRVLWKGALVCTALAAVVLVPMFPWLHSTMRYLSYSAGAGTSRYELIPLLMSNFTRAASSGDVRSGLDELIESWALRAEGPRNSYTMYQLSDSNESAGYMPILGAVVLPVPRVWWVGKPVAGSTDATNLGAAIYRVQQKRSAFYEMGPVLASAHAYWEGGWGWIFFAGIASGWMWGCLFLWAKRANRRSIDIMVLTMVAALPIDGFFSALNPVYTYVRFVWLVIIPISLLMTILHMIPRGPRLIRDGHAAQARFQPRAGVWRV